MGCTNTLTVLGNADITANNYTQNGAIDVTGVLTINVESDFDYVADFNGTINFNSINLNVGGNFSNDSANNFIWDAQNTLTVLGTAILMQLILRIAELLMLLIVVLITVTNWDD